MGNDLFSTSATIRIEREGLLYEKDYCHDSHALNALSLPRTLDLRCF